MPDTFNPAPERILELNSSNPPLPNLCEGAGVVVGNQTFDSTHVPFEWTPILNPTNEYDDRVAVAGWTIQPQVSGQDNPFLHPFGNDWECSIAPDPPYASVLAQTNCAFDDGSPGATSASYLSALATASQEGLPTLAVCGKSGHGVLGVEMDEGLIPAEYRSNAGDRIVVYGRWIVDDGHNDFHTEIHTPLMLAWARSISGPSPVAAQEMPNAVLEGGVATPFPGPSTFSRIITRPYFVSQYFDDGKSLFPHIIDQAESLNGFFETINPFEPAVLDAVATVSPYPFQGTHSLTYTVRTPQPRPNPNDELLVCYHFIVRDGCSVTLAQAGAGDDGISVTITLENLPPPPDPCQQYIGEEIGASNLVERIANTPVPTNPRAIEAREQALANAVKLAQEASAKLAACRKHHPTPPPAPPTYQAPALPAHETSTIPFDQLPLPTAHSLQAALAEFWAWAVSASFTAVTYAGQGGPHTRHDQKDLTWAKPVKDLTASDRTVHTVSNDQPFPSFGLDHSWVGKCFSRSYWPRA